SPLAGTKMLSWSFNLLWLEQSRRRGFDEVILLNERGEVSECTSANVFAAFGGEVRTPPLSSGCLPGVTRDLLLHQVRAPGVTVTERVLMPEDLGDADEVFITSTTRDLLPVESVEGKRMKQQGPARLALQREFSGYVDEYVRKRRLAPAR
ncbi:MAG: aminotransferase class IV, partial [Bryobacteraceae bacterium]